MRKVLFLFIIFFIPFALFSQENREIIVEEAPAAPLNDPAGPTQDEGVAPGEAEGAPPDLPADGAESSGTETEAEPTTAADASESSADSSGEDSAEEEKKSVLDPAYVLERDIETSTDAELADWCLSLGLESQGGRETLAARIREHFRLHTAPEAGTAVPTTGETRTVTESAETAEDTITIIIESAKNTEYFTVESVEEDYVRLSGGVSISIQDGEILHRVKAGQILYNRTRKFMSATGSVEYVKEEGDTVETFRGEGITVNLDNWSTAFMKGVSDHELTEGETSYRFSGEVISRSGEDSTVLRRAEITNAKDKESYWSITASKLWLLPGSDWAAVNAVIKVGEIPVLWLPGFYYPADEIIFHPVLGYKAREGTYLQTTTYILGRPKATESSEESSITSIMGSGEGMEKERHGIFLRSTGTKVVDENEPRLSVMADAYVNLGYYLASELTLPPSEHFGELLFSAGFGFSRDIALSGGIYTPFFPDYDGTSNWHSSRLFDATVPFRYRFVTSGSTAVSGTVVKNANVTWSLPFYSDPYVDNDFMNRSEDSSLFSLIRNATSDDTTVNDTSLSSYIWQLNGSLSFSTTGMEPYINNLSVNNAAVAVSFSTRTSSPAPDSSLQYSPNRSFFYPDRFTLFSVPISVSGTPITINEEIKKIEEEESALIPLWPNPDSPWSSEEDPENNIAADKTELIPPLLTRAVNTSILGGHRFTLNYRLTPSAASELRFNSDKPGEEWRTQEDIDWSDVEYQLYTLRADGNIGLTLSEKRDIYTHALNFYGSSSWQDYTYMNESVPDARKQTMTTQAHNMTSFSTTSEYIFTLRPFFQSDVWQTSNFRYALRGLLVSGAYTNDVWDMSAGSWDREDITTHQVQGNFNANIMDYMQNFSITADLPPEESALTASATARAWISETNANAKVRDPFGVPYYEPVSLTETLRFSENISLRHNMVYDPELSEWTSMETHFIWKSLSAVFTARRSKSYYLDETPGNVGWKISSDEEKLNPQNLTLRYNKTHTLGEGSSMSFTGSVDTGLSFDLQRYTSSNFYFVLGIGAHVNRFLDITLSSRSENAVVYRYFQNTPLFGGSDVEVPGERNPFVDLVNSFRFDDTRKRQESGFKLKSFNLNLVHHLGDWDATLGIKLYPEQNTATREFRFMNEISFLVQWKPIKEFKTDLIYTTDEGFSYD